MADKPETFFVQLYKLTKNIEHDISDLQRRVEEKVGDNDDNNKALQILQDTKNDVKQLKVETQISYTDFSLSGKKFNKVLAGCQVLLEFNRNQLTKIEDHLSNYGYMKPDVAEEDINENVEGEEENERTNIFKDGVATNSQDVTTPPSSIKEPSSRTPKLEDFGISSYGMQAMYRNHQNKPLTRKVEMQQYEPAVPTTNYCNRLDSVPSAFQHNGLTVTPSIIGKFAWPPYTPDSCVGISNYKKSLFDEASSSFSQTPFNLSSSITDSPVPPVFRTPGAKQINKDISLINSSRIVQEYITNDTNKPEPPIFRTPGIKQINDNLSEIPHKRIIQPSFTSDIVSPAPPVLQTTGMKQINKHKKHEEIPDARNNDHFDNMEEPEPPDLTTTFQGLSNSINKFNTTFEPLEPVSLSERFGYTGEKSTPPRLELLSSRLIKMGIISNESPYKSEVPRPPTLLSKYRCNINQENMPL